MNNIIIVAGAPASGKSVAKKLIEMALRSDGRTVISMSDKDALLQEVALDMAGRVANPDGSIESDDTILLNPLAPPESWGMVFKTSRALNAAHESMFRQMAEISERPSGIILAEVAYGVDAPYPNGPLRQSAGEYVTQFVRLGIARRMFIVDIQASLAVRTERNNRRPVGHIPEAEFRRYFRDGGGFTTREQLVLDGRYYVIHNEKLLPNEFAQAVDGSYRTFLRPGLGIEGRQRKPEVL